MARGRADKRLSTPIIGYHRAMSNETAAEQAQQTEQIATLLAESLLQRGLRLVTAESCTGGLVAGALTELAGSSSWFEGGVITYSNEAKQRLLQVPAALLAAGGPGAVSEETVLAMTAGALAHSRAQLAVAVSGIAGPDGGSPAKPVGTVWIAWRLAAGLAGEQGGQGVQSEQPGRAVARCYRFPGGREAVRQAAVAEALAGCVEILKKIPPEG